MRASRVCRLRKLAYGFGAIICVASLAYVGVVFFRHLEGFRHSDWRDLEIQPLIGASLLYAAALLATSAVWPLLVHSTQRTTSFARLLLIGLASQSGKYLPGNVVHYFGRAALARTYAIGWKRSAEFTVLELSTAVTAGLLVAFLSILSGVEHWRILSDYIPEVAAVVLGAAGAISVFGLRAHSAAHVMSAFGSSVAAFVLAGYSFYLVTAAMPGFADGDRLTTIGMFALAWIAGFVVPGVPAGLGIREVILLGLLAPSVGSANAVLAVGVHRLLSIGIDVLVALVAGVALWRGKHGSRQALD